MKKKIRVAVLMGGLTPEHEISLISGREVVRYINKKRYDVLPVVISRDGNVWKALTVNRLLTLPSPLSLKGTKKELVQKDYQELSGVGEMSKRGVDVVFIAMHGPFGEDGTVQGMLELAGIPYTGPGVLASALGMDKLIFRKLMKAEGFLIPEYVVIRKGESLNKAFNLGSPPYFVKPHNQGSSVGNSFVRDKKGFREALKLAHKYSDIALVDKYVKGIEVTCGVIGNEKPEALPLVEIVPKIGDFFNYDSKYLEGGAEEICPARISPKIARKVQDLSIKIYKLINCRGFSRIDFILENGTRPVVLEINTIPGLTPTSLLPREAKAAGISYSQLIDKIIQLALV